MSDEEIVRLMAFYAVETIPDLIAAQDRHIASLQETVARLQPPDPFQYYRKAREG